MKESMNLVEFIEMANARNYDMAYYRGIFTGVVITIGIVIIITIIKNSIKEYKENKLESE